MRATEACLLLALAGCAAAQLRSSDELTTTTTPVPILRQINRVNDDGSYTFGFEAADGSFKLETRSANGEVTGKYGYVDADGIQRVFDYNASKGAGFAPTSELIPSPPPGLPLASTSQVAPGTFVGDIDVALDGYSEDLDEDGFVDPIPTELLNRSRQQVRRPAAPAPAPAPAFRAQPAPRPAAPAPAPEASDSNLPAGTFRFTGQAPQQLLPQPQPQPQPQQFAVRLPQQQQQQFVPQQFDPQQFAPQQPQQFAPQQFAPQQPQQFAPPQFLPPQQFGQRARQLPQQAPQPFFNVQGFDANNGVVRGFRAN